MNLKLLIIEETTQEELNSKYLGSYSFENSPMSKGLFQFDLGIL